MSFSHRTSYERTRYSYYSPRIPSNSQIIYQLLPHNAQHVGLIESDTEYSLKLYTFRPISTGQDIKILSTDGADRDRSLETFGTVARCLKNDKPRSEQDRYISHIRIHRTQ